MQKKLPKYYGQNLLAASLNENCFQNNPNFVKFIVAKNLSFNSYNEFNKKSIKDRQILYIEIAKHIWDIDNIKKFVI